MHSFVGKYANDVGIVVGNVVVGVAVLGDRKEWELLVSPSGRIEERQFAVYAFPGFFVIRIYIYIYIYIYISCFDRQAVFVQPVLCIRRARSGR